MNLSMFEIIGTNTEGLTTHRANVRFLSCVKSRVNLQNEIKNKRRFKKSLIFQLEKRLNDSSPITLFGFSTYLKIFERFESFGTNFTSKVANSVVHVAHVTRPLLVGPKCLPTLVAYKWMFSCMNGHVHFKMRPVFESASKKKIKDCNKSR